MREVHLSGTKSGSTTGAYVAALTIDTRGTPLGEALILIKNTHVSSTMYFKILGYPADAAADTGLYETIVDETSLAASTQHTSVGVHSPYAALVVLVKQNSAAGTYQIDYGAY